MPARSAVVHVILQVESFIHLPIAVVVEPVADFALCRADCDVLIVAVSAPARAANRTGGQAHAGQLRAERVLVGVGTIGATFINLAITVVIHAVASDILPAARALE